MTTLLIAYTSQAKSLETKDLGTVGETYPIVEADVVKELQRQAMQNKQKSENFLLEELKKYQPMNLYNLPRAESDSTYLVDMSYSLDRDLVDGSGKVIYPKGYTFNPLDYLSFPGGLVIIDGEDPQQLQWYKTSPYVNLPQARLLLSGGYAFEIVEQLRRPAFYLTGDIAKRLKLYAVPAVVIQEGKQLLVREVYIPRNVKGDADEK